MPKSNSSRRQGKKKPWDPRTQARPTEFSEQLGFPKKERLNKSKAGFEAEQLAVGARRDGVVRSREKSMLTHPALLAERRTVIIRAYVEQGKELPSEGIKVPETPSDRASAQWRHLLWQYLQARYESINGKCSSTNFEKSSHSSDINKIPLTDNQFKRLGFYYWLRKQPGWKELTDFLDDIAAQCNPQACSSDHRLMSKVEIGSWLLDSDNPRDAKCAVDGALALACRALAGAAAEYSLLERRKKKILTSGSFANHF